MRHDLGAASLSQERDEGNLGHVRQRLSDTQQLAIAGRLLLDEEARHPRWSLDWLAPYVASLEALWLAGLATRVAQETRV